MYFVAASRKKFTFTKTTLLLVKSCEKSIPEAWKCFLDPDSGKKMCVLKRKSKNFEISPSKSYFWEVISCEKSIARIPEALKCLLDPDSGKLVHVGFRFNTHSYFPESESRKHFQDLGMRAIDFSHNFTPI